VKIAYHTTTTTHKYIAPCANVVFTPKIIINERKAFRPGAVGQIKNLKNSQKILKSKFRKCVAQFFLRMAQRSCELSFVRIGEKMHE